VAKKIPAKRTVMGADPSGFLGKAEPLHPDLVEHLFPDGEGMVVHHPLIISHSFSPGFFGEVNRLYMVNKQDVIDAEAKRDWTNFMLLHERPYRFQTFRKIRNRLSDAEYWEVLGNLYTDSETIHCNLRFLRPALTSTRPCRERIMNPQERRFLAKQGERLTIYRGCRSGRKIGWSWTLDRRKAEWFARRFEEYVEGSPIVLIGEVDKNDVIAYFADRKEKEIVVDPKKVKVVGRETITFL